ncbi:MAG: SIMPL domain-containing protein [Patescibacteria group bacterium]
MDIKIKNALNIAIIIVLLTSAYAVISYVNSYASSIEPSAFRSFSISGEGKITAIPDVASFTFSVIIEGNKDITKLQKENTEKVNKIIAFVKSSGVELKDIKTRSYNLEPRYQYFNCPMPLSDGRKPCPLPEIVGYTIRQTVEIKIRDFGKIGDVLAGTVEKGANSVSELSFTIDDSDKIKNQAREEAIAKAKEKALSIAKAGGFKLGRLLSIDEGGYIPYADYGYQTMVKSAESLPSPIIEPGSQEIVVNIVLRYEIR